MLQSHISDVDTVCIVKLNCILFFITNASLLLYYIFYYFLFLACSSLVLYYCVKVNCVATVTGT